MASTEMKMVSRSNSMKSKITERTFWLNEGWFINLRNVDANLVSYAGNKRVPVRASVSGVIAGPFASYEQLENWFDTFLNRHASPREVQTHNGEIDMSISGSGIALELMEIEATRMLDKGNVVFHFG